MARQHDASGAAFIKPCSSYAKCNHKKHGYGRRKRHEEWTRLRGWVSPAKKPV